MSPLVVTFTAAFFIFYISPVVEAKCPATMPIKIGKYCYRFQTDPLRFGDARDNCMKLEAGGMITSYKFEPVLKKLKKLIYDFVLSKLENAVWWIGIKLDDTSLSKAAEDRTWSTDYDESKWVQKDYKMWETEGGPKDKGLTCAVINGSNEFKVKPVDCGGPRVPVICMMKKGEKCKHRALPYLQYGPHCIAALNGAAEYNKIHGACSPNTPTPFEDDEMKRWVVMAAKNSFLGGGLYMNMIRNGDKFYDLSDGSSPPDDMWEEGEPQDQYDCVGLSLQLDNSLKLKTMSCDFFASSLCFVQDPDEEIESAE